MLWTYLSFGQVAAGCKGRVCAAVVWLVGCRGANITAVPIYTINYLHPYQLSTITDTTVSPLSYTTVILGGYTAIDSIYPQAAIIYPIKLPHPEVNQ